MDEKKIEGGGIKVKKVKSLQLKNGRSLTCKIVVLTAGIKPNVELARSIGLEISQGILVDDFMQTSHPGILAAGDVAGHQGQIPGLWATVVLRLKQWP